MNELPLKPTKVGNALIASMCYLYPECYVETERQGIAPFSCCDPNRKAMCDVAGRCPFAMGVTHRKLPITQDIRLFVGYGEDFVIVWFTLLPAIAQAKKTVDVREFFASLLNDDPRNS